jgi:hypothetical protein
MFFQPRLFCRLACSSALSAAMPWHWLLAKAASNAVTKFTGSLNRDNHACTSSGWGNVKRIGAGTMIEKVLAPERLQVMMSELHKRLQSCKLAFALS